MTIITKKWRLSVILVGFFLVSCQTGLTAPGWGAPDVVGTSDQVVGPAILEMGGGITAAWARRDATEHILWLEQLPNAVRQPLVAKAPRDLGLFSGADGTFFLLWRDWAVDEERFYLYGLFLNPDLSTARAPTRLAGPGIRAYAAAPGADGGMWAFWVEAAAPGGLYARWIDRVGRAIQEPDRIAFDVAWVAAAGDWLVWLAQDGDLLAWRIPVDAEGAPRFLGRVDDPARVKGLRLGLDLTTGYVFWQDGNGAHALIFSLEGLSEGKRLPVSLAPGLRPEDYAPVDFGLNAGMVAAPREGIIPAQINPAAGQRAVLPAAIILDGRAGAAYFRDGALIGYQLLPSEGRAESAALAVNAVTRDLWALWWECEGASGARLVWARTG